MVRKLVCRKSRPHNLMRVRGGAQIVLRPEQVTFVAVPKQTAQDTSASTGCFGKVVEVDSAARFVLSQCACLIRPAKSSPNIPHCGCSPPIQTPQPGAIPRITVIGAAHVFPVNDR
jgi:hypothetical protein